MQPEAISLSSPINSHFGPFNSSGIQSSFLHHFIPSGIPPQQHTTLTVLISKDAHMVIPAFIHLSFKDSVCTHDIPLVQIFISCRPNLSLLAYNSMQFFYQSENLISHHGGKLCCSHYSLAVLLFI